jgi:uncharacterized protein YndB with AHSA1/START domain
MTPHKDEEHPPKSIEVEIEVPGTPEQVWNAIATGPGVSSWLFPIEIVEREGGAVSFDAGGGMESAGLVSAWEPPRRFVYGEPWESEDGSTGSLATEWLIDARRGGTCLVRLVSSGFARRDGWEDEFESMSQGWDVYLSNLRLYLTEFPGERGSSVMVRGAAPGTVHGAWEALRRALGLAEAAEGGRVSADAPGSPTLAGVARSTFDASHHRGLMLRIDDPAPGIGLVFGFAYRGEVYAAVQTYLFGDDGPALAAREQGAWEAWMGEHFPSAEATPAS